MALISCASPVPSAPPLGTSSAPESPVPAIETAPAESLRLAVVGDPMGPDVTVELYYTQLPDEPGPRAIEVQLELSGNVALVRSVAGAALTRAGKQLVVQPDAGRVRLVAFGTGSLERIAGGPLAQLTFKRTDANAATLSLRPERPVFAPADADLGVRFGPALTLPGLTPTGGR
ncbi:MAG: hypothetical protein IV100_08645 [Myxococcales bacterium]|nr:hypothetical protein [Myxococcales bacterium]